MPGPERNAIQVLARPRPFSTERADLAVPAGLTLAEIVGVAIPDAAWHDHAVVLIGDERIERHAWAGFRPPPG
ncbi:MAG TPA: hypothetical protein VES39_09425, partial [Rhodospirillales bacterium]|nr:hypothetical protein [Rhodospirillales bacterium]